MQYCIYLRKSRKDMELEALGEGETLARHRAALLSLAKAKEISISEIYEEIVSGETISARPQMQRLLADVEDGKWTGVFVMEVERLARGDTIDQGIVAKAFKMSGTRIITPSKVYDPENEFDEEYFEFGLFMSRREFKTINRRIQRGRTASAKEGRFLSSAPPYGYDKIKIKNAKGYTLELNNVEAEAVKIIYDKYTGGSGMQVIARELDEMGISPRNGGNWSKSTISDILKNPVYTGKIRWSYRTQKEIKEDGKLIKKRRRNDEYILVDGLHPAIISREQFLKAEQMRLANIHKCTKKDLSLKNPLAGLVRCRKCGSLMTRIGSSPHNSYATLKCSNNHCDNISSPIISVEEEILQCLKAWINEQGYAADIQPHTESREMKLIKGSIRSHEKELEEIDKQVQNTYDLLERGIYNAEKFEERNKILSNRRLETEEKILSLKTESLNESDIDTVIYKILPEIEFKLDMYFNIFSAEDRNRILKQVLNHVEYEKNIQNRKGNALIKQFELNVFPKLPFNM